MAFVVFAIVFAVSAKVIHGVPLAPSGMMPHIIGGEDAPTAYAPHMAALVFGDRVQYLMCGGSIITRGLVLTAAHCIEPLKLENGELLGSFHTRVGSNKWNSGGTVVKVKSYHMHPQWDSKYVKFDAGVLVLNDKLELTDYVGIIGLAYDFVEGNERTSFTGWGRTGPRIEDNVVHLSPTPYDLQLLYVNTISHEQCQHQMTSVAGDIALPIQRDIEICTFHSDDHGACGGDSGSALVRISTREQIGIVSWGYNCADGAPDVFVRIYGIRNFVEPIINMYRD